MVKCAMRTLRGALLVLLALVGCKKKDDWTPTVVKISSVQLISAGLAPQPVRFKFAANSKLSLTVDMVLSLDTSVDGTRFPMPTLPGITMTMDVHIDSVTPAGDARWTATLAKMDVVPTPGAPADMVAKLEEGMRGATGFKGSGTFTTRGEL